MGAVLHPGQSPARLKTPRRGHDHEAKTEHHPNVRRNVGPASPVPARALGPGLATAPLPARARAHARSRARRDRTETAETAPAQIAPRAAEISFKIFLRFNVSFTISCGFNHFCCQKPCACGYLLCEIRLSAI
ncbi:unnamed protein product [Parnassius mnemosyne]|uniref:Uncharacterized protein n=1 Tax=Parnassius mnemosyne TaxID=213953 RepID=A0AAV1LFJ8_9NEOP